MGEIWKPNYKQQMRSAPFSAEWTRGVSYSRSALLSLDRFGRSIIKETSRGRHHCSKGQVDGSNYAQSNGRGSQPTGTVARLGRRYCWLKCTEWETHIIILIGSWVTDRRVISGGSPNSNRGSHHHDGGYNKIQSSPPSFILLWPATYKSVSFNAFSCLEHQEVIV